MCNLNRKKGKQKQTELSTKIRLVPNASHRNRETETKHRVLGRYRAGKGKPSQDDATCPILQKITKMYFKKGEKCKGKERGGLTLWGGT